MKKSKWNVENRSRRLLPRFDLFSFPAVYGLPCQRRHEELSGVALAFALRAWVTKRFSFTTSSGVPGATIIPRPARNIS